MELRLKLYPHWPPRWGGFYQRGASFPMGEQGVLIGVRLGRDLWSTQEYIAARIEYEGHEFSGHLVLKDDTLRKRVHTLLEQNVGRSIAEIGSLDLPD